MSLPIECHSIGSGIAIEIKRPERLGALDTECFLRIEDCLEQAQANPNCAWIVFFSRHSKAFCAGGDVKKLYEDYIVTHSFEGAERFFETEYRVDQKIWDYPKPILAFTHGITMGGGIGLIRGASHRVVSSSSVLAMPEISIGLYPDVGATFFLQSVPEPYRQKIAFLGMRFGAHQAIEWGLATHHIPEDSLPKSNPKLFQKIDQLPWEGSSRDHQIVSNFLTTLSVKPHSIATETESDTRDKIIRELFLKSADAQALWEGAHLLRANQEGPHPAHTLDPLLQGSPLSVAIIWEQLSRGAQLSRQQAFEWEFRLSMGCLREGDFFEGVRCRLIDKGMSPQWKYPSPAKVPASVLRSILG